MDQLTNGQILIPPISHTINNTPTDQQKLSICYFNMRSIVRRMSVLETSIASMNFRPDVVVVTETFIYDNEASFFNMEGYKSFHSARPYIPGKGRGGGTAIFVMDRVDLQCNFVSSVCFEDANILVIKMMKSNIHIVSVYRPDQTTMDSFIAEFDQILNSFKRSFVIGDVNINLLNASDSTVCDYLETVYSNGFTILNKIEPLYATRISNTVSTILDHIVTDVFDKTYEMSYIDTSISDHRQLILQFVESEPAISVNRPKATIDYERIDQIEDWNSVTTAKTFGEFETAIKSIIETNVRQTRRHNKKTPIKPWVTIHILDLIQRRESLYKLSKRFPTNVYIRMTLESCRKTIRSTIDTTKRNYYNHQISESIHDGRRLWTNLREIIFNVRATNRESIQQMNIDGKIVADQTEIAEHFNNFFVNIGSTLTNHLQMPSDEYFESFEYETTQFVDLQQADEHSVIARINEIKLSTATGPDSIPPKFLKRYKERISGTFSTLINESIASEVYPNELKESMVSPIFKEGDKRNCNNYRPVSVPSAVSKVYESFLNAWFVMFLSLNNIIHQLQYGFQRNSNTTSAVTNLTNFITENLDRGKYVGIIFLDIRKAFDSVNHEILMKKLRKLNLPTHLLNLLQSYLSNRKQFTKIGRHRSELAEITTGIVQGSRLGPTIFGFYINDIFQLVLKGIVQLFADDGAIMYKADTLEELQSKMQADLTTVNKWLKDNLLILNTDKTKFFIPCKSSRMASMVKNHNIQLDIDGETIHQVDHYNYLGLYLDNLMSWDRHIDKVKSSIAPYVFALNRTRRLLSRTTAEMIYFSYIHSHLTYAAPAWCGAKTSKLEKLRVLQHKALKAVFALPRLTPSASLYDERFLCVDNIIKYELITFVFKVINGLTRNNFVLTLVSDVHRYETRQQSNFYLATFKTSMGNLNTMNVGLALFNQLPALLKNETNLIRFKKGLKSYVSEHFKEL